MSKAKLFAPAPKLRREDQALVDLYAQIGRTLDDLPYTDDFEDLHAEAKALGDQRSRSEVIQRLMSLRKAAFLPRLGRAWGEPPATTWEEEDLMAKLLFEKLGSPGLRDRLPYTKQFDELAAEFNKRTGRSLSDHDVWRVIAKVAK